MKKKLAAVLLAGMMILGAGCGASGKLTLGEYKGLEIKSVTQAEVDEQIQSLLKESAELVAVDRAAEDGDTVNINYVGKKDGVAFDGGTDDSEAGTDLVLGSNTFIDGFEEGLIGTTAGQVIDLNLTFPETYGNEELAGQAVVFTVTVNEVKESVLPELTDTFIAENTETYKTVAEYTEALRANMNRNSYLNQLTTLIMESSSVEKYDEKAVAEEEANLISSYKSYAAMYSSYLGLDEETTLMYLFGFESTEAMETYAHEYAYELEKNDMIMNEIAKREKITVTKDIYNAEAAELAASMGYENVAAMEADNGIELIKEVILSDLVMEFMIDNAVIKDAE